MLSKYSNSRSLSDNIKLGTMTAFIAGMVNISSLIIFFSFTSNITGHYAILAEEITRGDWHQVAVVLAWIFLFFFGNFVSNLIIINFNHKNPYLAHVAPLVLEIICLLTVGIYGGTYYTERLVETELLISLLLFAMGLQNGLTASISNFAVKTTHMTGTMTDLGVLMSMFTKSEYRKKKELRGRAKLLSLNAFFYLLGGITAGFLNIYYHFAVYFYISGILVLVIVYDWYNIKVYQYLKTGKVGKFKKYSEMDVLGSFERKRSE
jgi:uncharacterized membrane protein YoaK (UPF0700 family)